MTGPVAPKDQTTQAANASGERDMFQALFAVGATAEPDVYTATMPPRRELPRLFGGQVAAQALLAAGKTLPQPRPPHSLHTYFVAMGRPEIPVHYQVATVRDGRAFSTRRVTATQEDRVILELVASFCDPEPGPDWSPPIGELTLPEQPESAHPRTAHLGDHLEVRLVRPAEVTGWQIHPFWFRAVPPVGPDSLHNTVMLTYVSDIALMANARKPGYDEPMAVAASLDHALWFHRIPQVDNWLLFSTRPVAHIGTRGLVHGSFHTEDGTLVATVVQEGLLRPQRRI